MKKFYPEDYFRRSGYAFEAAKEKKKDLAIHPEHTIRKHWIRKCGP